MQCICIQVNFFPLLSESTHKRGPRYTPISKYRAHLENANYFVLYKTPLFITWWTKINKTIFFLFRSKFWGMYCVVYDTNKREWLHLSRDFVVFFVSFFFFVWFCRIFFSSLMHVVKFNPFLENEFSVVQPHAPAHAHTKYVHLLVECELHTTLHAILNFSLVVKENLFRNTLMSSKSQITKVDKSRNSCVFFFSIRLFLFFFFFWFIFRSSMDMIRAIGRKCWNTRIKCDDTRTAFWVMRKTFWNENRKSVFIVVHL